MRRLIYVVVLSLVCYQVVASPAGLGAPPDPAERNLPVNFTGNDLALVIKRFDAYSRNVLLTAKGEFETTAEFQARRTAVLNRDLDSEVPIGMRFVFTFPAHLRYDADTQKIIGGLLGNEGPPEARLSLRPSGLFDPVTYSMITGVVAGPVKAMVPYEGRWGGSFMVEQVNSSADGITFCWRDSVSFADPGWRPAPPCPLSPERIRFEMAREKAQEIIPRLRIAVFGSIDRERPIVTASTAERTPTPEYAWTASTRFSYLPIIPSAAVIYDQTTGEIVYRLNLLQSQPVVRNARAARR